MLKDRNLIAPTDFSVDEIEELMQLADRIVEDPDRFNEAARHKVMATLFYEPSTRTQFSFQTAMNRLGGSVIGFSDPSTSSTAKGETVADTARTVSQFVDIIGHPEDAIAQRERLKAEREAARNERVSAVLGDTDEIVETPDEEQNAAVDDLSGSSVDEETAEETVIAMNM